MKRLNPLNDYLFKKLLGEKGDEEQLLSFLNAVLSAPGKERLISVEILENRTLNAEIIGDKECILDVRALTNRREKINIEVQLKDLHNMSKRSLFYWSREYLQKMAEGDDYRILPNVITINIVNFDYIPLEAFHTSFHLREDKAREYVLTEALEIHFINMVKFRRQKEKDIKNNLLERWVSFLDETTAQNVIEEIVQMDSDIQKTADKLGFLLQDKDALDFYYMRAMAKSDITTGLNTALEQGIQIGEQRGMKIGEQRGIQIGEQRGEQRGIQIGGLRRDVDIARKALYAGLNVETIETITGLDKDTINRLKG